MPRFHLHEDGPNPAAAALAKITKHAPRDRRIRASDVFGGLFIAAFLLLIVISGVDAATKTHISVAGLRLLIGLGCLAAGLGLLKSRR